MFLRWKWWRFNLAAVFVAVTIVAIAAAIYGWHLRDLAAEEVAFERLAASGANIYVFNDSGERRVHVSFYRRERVSGGNLIRFVKRSGERVFDDQIIEWLADVNDLGSFTFPLFEESDERIARLQQFHPSCRVNR